MFPTLAVKYFGHHGKSNSLFFFILASIGSASTNCGDFNMAPNPSCPIPVVDFSAMSLDVKDPDRSNQAVKDLANQVYQAFSTIGVVYITNHGIPQETASLSFSNKPV